jgi:hypothetical protein
VRIPGTRAAGRRDQPHLIGSDHELDPVPGAFYVATITGSWIVSAAWPPVAIVLALVVVRRRDV